MTPFQHSSLNDSSFNLLADLTSVVLREAESKADFSSPKILMNLAATFYHTVGGLPEFLYVL